MHLVICLVPRIMTIDKKNKNTLLTLVRKIKGIGAPPCNTLRHFHDDRNLLHIIDIRDFDLIVFLFFLVRPLPSYCYL